MPEATPGPEDGSTPTLDGRARLLAALRRPGSRGQVVVALLLAVLGFAAVTQVKANGKDDSFVGARQSELIQYINSLALASQRAEAEIATLQRTRDSLGSDTQARRTALERARTQADTLGILAGTRAATGPGVRIEVSDGGSGVGTNQLVDGLQELRDAGAEVIDLNGKVRVVAQTSFEQGVGGLLVDGTLVESPYVVDVIGVPNTLSGAIEFALGPRQQLERDGATIEVSELNSLDIESVRQPAPSEFTDPD